MKAILLLLAFLALPCVVNAQTVSAPVKLTWQDNSGNEDGFTIYRDGKVISKVGPNTTSFGETVIGVANQKVCYEVTAYNTAGESAKSNQSCATLPAPVVTVPNPPTGLTTSATAQTTIQTSWDVNNPEGTVSVILTRQRLTPPELKTIALGVDAQTYIDLNLPRKQTFCYQARAENASGVSAVSNQSCATTR